MNPYEETLTWLDQLIADTIPHVAVSRTREAARWPELAPNPAPSSTYILYAPRDFHGVLGPREELSIPLGLSLTVPLLHMAVILPLMPLLQKKKPLDVVLDYLPAGTTEDLRLHVRNPQDRLPLAVQRGEPLAQLLLVKLETHFLVMQRK
jgi:hypothetical protein